MSAEMRCCCSAAALSEKVKVFAEGSTGPTADGLETALIGSEGSEAAQEGGG